MVREDHRTADIFKQFGITFCCTEDSSVRRACELESVPIDRVVYAIQSLPTDENILEYQDLALEELLDKMELHFHRYFRWEIPNLTGYLDKIERMHSTQITEIGEVAYWWRSLSAYLTEHLIKLEFAIYPHIRKLLSKNEQQPEFDKPVFGSLTHVLHMFRADQAKMCDAMDHISDLTHEFQIPISWCNTVVVLYRKFADMAVKLTQYVEIHEKHIFPKAIELEKHVMG